MMKGQTFFRNLLNELLLDLEGRISLSRFTESTSAYLEWACVDVLELMCHYIEKDKKRDGERREKEKERNIININNFAGCKVSSDVRCNK